jgi:hypothetical protein
VRWNLMPEAARLALRVGLAGVLLYGLAGFASVRLSRAPDLVPLAALETPDLDPPRVWTLSGVLSVHTERSHDARGTPAEVARAARSAGIDFVVLGDHPGDWASVGQGALDPGREFGVLLVGGVELVVNEVGRVLVTGLDSVPRSWEGSVGALLDASGPDGFVQVIHPRSPRLRERWKVEAPRGVHAWEALDVSEMARTRLGDRWAGYHLASFLGALVVRRGHESLLRLGREGFEVPGVLAFDTMRAFQPLTITAGVNHHPKTRVLGGPFPSYRPFFRTVVNHVLLEGPPGVEPGAAWTQVAGALRSGRSYVSLGAAGPAEGFRFGAHVGNGGWVEMGGVGPATPEAELHVELPDGVRGRLLVRLLRNGSETAWVEAGAGERLRWPVSGPGIFRVEVYRAGRRLGPWRWNLRPWLLSNPVELTPDGDPA